MTGKLADRMRKGALGALLALACLAAPFAAGAQSGDISKEKRAAIEELMKVTGTADLLDQVFSQVSNQVRQALKAQNPGKGEAIDDIFLNHYETLYPKYRQDFLDLYVVVYNKHLTLTDVRELVKFYKTPLGQKLREVTPKVTQEAMQGGAVIGQKMAREALTNAKQDLKDEGVSVPF